MNIHDLGTMAVHMSSVAKSSSMLPFYKILLGNARGNQQPNIMISNVSLILKHWSVTQDKYFPLTDPNRVENEKHVNQLKIIDHETKSVPMIWNYGYQKYIPVTTSSFLA